MPNITIHRINENDSIEARIAKINSNFESILRMWSEIEDIEKKLKTLTKTVETAQNEDNGL